MSKTLIKTEGTSEQKRAIHILKSISPNKINR